MTDTAKLTSPACSAYNLSPTSSGGQAAALAGAAEGGTDSGLGQGGALGSTLNSGGRGSGGRGSGGRGSGGRGKVLHQQVSHRSEWQWSGQQMQWLDVRRLGACHFHCNRPRPATFLPAARHTAQCLIKPTRRLTASRCLPQVPSIRHFNSGGGRMVEVMSPSDVLPPG